MISIIVPVYNAEKYIAATIEMVRRQTYEEWELILVDDCSKDRSVDIILENADSEPGKIRLIRKTENEGAAKARNAGVDAARGRYIAFLDADDLWYKNKLEKEMAFMEKHDAAFVFTAYKFGDESGVPTGKIVHVPKLLGYKKALGQTVIFTSTVLIDTEKVDKSLIHMPDMGSEDTATWWRILKSGINAYGLDEPLAVYRRPAHSLSSDKGVAVKRIWNLYRTVAGLSAAASLPYMIRWAFGATIRRTVADTVRSHAEVLKRFAVIELSLIGILFQTGLFAYVWFSRYYPVISSFRYSQEGIPFGYGLKLYFRGHVLVLAIYLVVLLFLAKTNGGLKTGYLKPGSIFTSQVTALAFTDIIMYFQISLMHNWLAPAGPMVALAAVQAVFAGGWALASDWVYRSVFPPVEALAIQGEESLSLMVQAFNARQDRFKVMRTLKAGADNLQEVKDECLQWYGAVIMGAIEDKARKEILQFCYSHYIRVYFLPDIADILVHGSEVMDLFGAPVMELKEYNISWEMRLVKRLADIMISGLLLAIASPILLGGAAYGKARFGKSFQGEICATKHKRAFVLHTFAPGGGQSWINRLPALWDVLRGKMSMVGPAPLPAAGMDELIASDIRYAYRLRVKAGFTGNAQVYGKQAAGRDGELMLDLFYIQHFSILLDLKLLLLSVGRRRKDSMEAGNYSSKAPWR